MNKVITPVLIVLLLLMFLYANKLREEVSRLNNNIEVAKGNAKEIRLRNGDLAYEVGVLKKTNRELRELDALNKDLKRELKDVKTVNSVLRSQFTTRTDTVYVPIKDGQIQSGMLRLPYSLSLDSLGWTFDQTIDSTGVFINRNEFIDSLSVVIGIRDGLFRKPSHVAVAYHSSPYVKMESIEVSVLHDERIFNKWWFWLSLGGLTGVFVAR